MAANTRLIDNSSAGTTYYRPIYNEKKEMIKENLFTNSLNALGYIPGISTITGLTRNFCSYYVVKN